jgi:SagB-type dehydrogenase family enzyme
MTSAKEEITRLIGALSDYECAHLLSAFQDVAAGERFWELDISAVYNEHVKTRLLGPDQPADDVVPAGPHPGAGIFAPIPIVKSYPDAARVELPPPGTFTASLADTLLKRRSRRDYTGQEIDRQQLATMLHYACGVTGTIEGYGYRQLPLRTFPSSGGLQAPEVYLSVQAVTGVAPGLYHYHIVDHLLELMRPGTHGPLLAALAFQQPYLATASVVFLVTGRFERLRWKYSQRAYKYMCMDVGYLGQNLYLVAEGMGLGACAIAGFVDDAMEQLLDIDGRNEMILLLTTVGVPSSASSF